MTFLELVQQAANELGIPEPSQVLGGQDDTSRQLLALSNREGKEFSQLANKNGGWQILHKEYQFFTNGVSGITGDTVINTAIIQNMNTTTGLSIGMTAVGNGIPVDAQILTVDSATQVTLNTNITATDTVDMTFGFDNYAFPSDLEYFVDKTFWDGSFRWQLLGPLEAQEKNVIKYGISPVGPRRRFWMRNNRFYLNPVPTNTTDFIAFDYFSNAWCTSSLGVPQTKWLDDSDIYLLDEDCFIQGLKFRYLRSKGLDYAQEYADYMDSSNRVMARDGAGRDLPMNAQAAGVYLLSDANIPDTGFGT